MFRSKRFQIVLLTINNRIVNRSTTVHDFKCIENFVIEHFDKHHSRLILVTSSGSVARATLCR
jgi:hypothetical protein